MSNKKQGLQPKLRFPEFRTAGDWEEKKLEDVAPLQRGFDLPSEQIKPGEIPVVYSNGIQNFHNKGMAKGPGLVTGRSGTIGKIHFIEEGDYWPHNTSLWVTSFKGNFPKFIYYLYKSIGITQFASGSGVPTLNRNDVHVFQASLPASINEQQKIADCLSSLDELITAQAQKIEALKAHKKGLMQQLFPTEGETTPSLRFPEFIEAAGWEEKTLDELVNYENGKAHENFIVDSGKYVVVNSKFISTEGEVKKYTDMGFCIAKKDDILMVLSDVPNGKAIGKCYMVETDGLYTVNQRICRLTPQNIIGKFLFFTLDRNPFFLSFDDGVKQTNLRKEEVLSCLVFYPLLSNEQQKITDCLSSLDELISLQTQKLEALKTHKKGLMQQLFPDPDTNNEVEE